MKHDLIADGSGALAALEQICPACDGEGRLPNRREGNRLEFGGRCDACHGSGTVVTEDGRRLLEFLRWHQR